MTRSGLYHHHVLLSTTSPSPQLDETLNPSLVNDQVNVARHTLVPVNRGREHPFHLISPDLDADWYLNSQPDNIRVAIST